VLSTLGLKLPLELRFLPAQPIAGQQAAANQYPAALWRTLSFAPEMRAQQPNSIKKLQNTSRSLSSLFPLSTDLGETTLAVAWRQTVRAAFSERQRKKTIRRIQIPSEA
jgi:hypothetical protein